MIKRTTVAFSPKILMELKKSAEEKKDIYAIELLKRSKNTELLKEIFEMGFKKYTKNQDLKLTIGKDGAGGEI